MHPRSEEVTHYKAHPQTPMVIGTFPLEDLPHSGRVDVFNIEAGKPAVAIDEDALWFNLAFVMDTSLVNGTTLNDLNKNSEYAGYLLKEAGISEYNEMDVNLATLLTVKYCLEQGHRLRGKPVDEVLNFVVHTHRASTGIVVNKLIAQLLMKCVPNYYEPVYQETIDKKNNMTTEIVMLKIPSQNTVIHFRRGFAEELTDPVYKQADILFSYSMVGGLSEELKSGSLTMPHTFVPFDDKNYLLYPDETYTAKNHMISELDAILAQPQEMYFEILQNTFKSENQNKMYAPRTLTKENFHPVKVLQVNDLFHPVKANEGEPSIHISVMSTRNLVNNEDVKFANQHNDFQTTNRRLEMNVRKNICAGTLGVNTVEEMADAIRAGYRRFDLATAYKTNKVLGNAIAQEQIQREEFDICTKINDGDLINHNFSVHSILKEILSDLNTTYVDTLMLHSPALLLHDKALEVFEELIKLKKAGLIKHIGVSNFTVEDLNRLDKKYLKHIDYNSIEMSPYCQQKETVTFCQENNITIMPYRPFGKGNKADDLLQNEVLLNIAAKHNATIFQVILAWAMQQDMIVIAKASKNHLSDNLKACELVLDQDDMMAISRLDRNLHTCDWEPFVKLANFNDYKNVPLIKPEKSAGRFGIYGNTETPVVEANTILQTATMTPTASL